MNFESETKTSTFDASETINSTINERASQRTSRTSGYQTISGDSVTHQGSGSVDTLDSVSLVGMSVDKVTEARQAIEEYCANIENYLNGLDTTATGAYKGDGIVPALESYMSQVKTYCINLVSQLRAFSDKLADARNQWQASTAEMAQNIQNNAGNYSTGSSYESTIQ